ncbi:MULTISPECIES: benzoate 1,2-dioxygenase electron transfer component BenC [Actinomycetes]|uniref:benzoate 1,2-dioxygenase electron transfer component BenC n=1 Tax=Actinomycetes TaxID=1760 RepID=UPI0004C0D943|nr:MULTISPECIES: benzoate 1,2-dioxygenase electron transfer component BenC [Actinomycetes]
MTSMQETAPAATGHQVALSFEDGVTRFITCREDQTVADASYRQRINIPLDCRDGACGTCKALCESGDYDGGTYISDALSDDEAAEGYALPCSMKPRSDLVLQIAASSAIAKTEAATYTARLVELDRISPTTVRFGFEIENRSALVFLPGQYVNISVPGTDVTRSYSFSNGPHDGRLTFLVKLNAGGAMSDYLTERAAIGDELTFTGPHGSFFLRESDRPILLLAGGTGLAPILSMLRKLRAEGSRRKAHLIYGVSTDDDMVESDELDSLVGDLDGFTWEHCVSGESSTATNKGYVTSLLAPHHFYDGDVAIYLCGPPPMVEAVRQHVKEVGIEPTGFYYEKFALAVPAGGADAVEPTTTVDTTPELLEELLVAPDGRSLAGQVMMPAVSLEPWPEPVGAYSDEGAARRIAGQLMVPPATGGSTSSIPLDTDSGILESAARGIADQVMFAADYPEPLTTAASTTVAEAPRAVRPTDTTVTVGAGGYEIGEDHPAVHESDALFEARRALELGALEVTLGRLNSRQLAGYRLLAESTLPHVEGDHFVNASEYTETNAAFHDYLFTLTGNEHLLQAYKALGVKGRMAEVLRNATWCHPLCAQDHIDIVSAFEAGDRDAARSLIIAHAERSKQTMRRAMADTLAARTPRFVTPGRFAGKVVVVTGAAQGIGEHTARRISAEGGKLVLADRSELVKELADELSSGGAAACAVTADLEHWEGADTVVQQSISAFGRVDVLINNVGGAINFKPFTEFTDSEIRAEIDRSLLTTLYTCRAALPGMVSRGGGVIVNVSSAATRGVHRIPYSAAKGGINAITASLAMEYADAGIRVVATAPGGTEAPPRRISRGTPEPAGDTERAWFQAHIDQTLSSSLLKRYGTLEEQAAAICFLASDEASYITGTVLPVAGGDLG